MLLFYDIIAKSSASHVDRLGVERKRQPLLDLLPRVVKARRARRREADAACCDFGIRH
ncbi:MULTISPECIES: hypothetical protein [Pseudomonadaceae]|uniref:Uncharacterized protein n=1 Tax=Pseudomonas straminea TaxID=47882 RepID=A0A1I1YYY1_PSEOC|nr:MULTISPECIES: hypothetical protein [Pseudomonas]MDD1510475.1 hypothetical protein [Pseudomonas sp. CNPSo 3701]TWE01334.1 hypothetical protein FB481_11285 [Pseudomonas sp. AG1028]GLX16061.1 hypothetical protein Pstr01_43000 [Pseudomonas straminea]SFE24679.1 hypothetical protein SAMN05216372_1139 [Pseudomonas straminea]